MNGLTAMIVALLWLIPEACIGAWMLKVMINWFAPHVYEGIHVNFLQALALACVISWCTAKFTPTRSKDSTPEKQLGFLFESHIIKWITFGLFGIIHAVFF